MCNWFVLCMVWGNINIVVFCGSMVGLSYFSHAYSTLHGIYTDDHGTYVHYTHVENQKQKIIKESLVEKTCSA